MMLAQGISPLYSVYFAPRGYARMLQMGMQVAQNHLTAFDRLVGVIGEAGSGKSLLIKGMFPGLELTNDDDGVNVRPLPLLDIHDDTGFYQAHTYHLDVRFEAAFTQMHVLADHIRIAIEKGKRVVVEHFDLIYSALGMNAALLVGVGEEVIVSRPTPFGPEPDEVARVVFASNKYRRMAHTAEDLTERYLAMQGITTFAHGDVRHGFLLRFREKPDIDTADLEQFVRSYIQKDVSVSYGDDQHVVIGGEPHLCTGPRMHVTSTGEIKNFHVLKDMPYDPLSESYILIGLVGEESADVNIRDLNRIMW